MASLNRWIGIGNLTRDPELRNFGGGVCNLGLAVNESWKDKSGEWQERTCFVDVALWGKSAEGVSQRFKKGDSVLVEGSLQLEQWEDKKDGSKRSKHAIKAMSVKGVGGERVDKGGDAGTGTGTGTGTGAGTGTGTGRDEGGFPEQADDMGLPF